MTNEQYISQREWEYYVEARDEQTRLRLVPEEQMTKELWSKWHKSCRTIGETEEKCWEYIDELHQRYKDSLDRVD